MKDKTNLLKVKKLLKGKVIINEAMAVHTTLGIGGPASLYTEVVKEEDLRRIIKVAIKEKVAYIVIGEGSNLLISDNGYQGIVIKDAVEGISIVGQRVIAKGGTNLQKFINYCVDKGLSGCEKMSGIPGAVGGAIYGNAGAYGQTISDYLVSVKAFNGRVVKVLDKKMCLFGYRDSIFKKNGQIILEGEFIFEKGSKEFLKRISLDTISLRLQKYPQGIKCPGSFFKNIEAGKLAKKTLEKIPKDKIIYGKIPAGYLMETVGAKGKVKGSIKIADHHGNLIVNLGAGKASDFHTLAFDYAEKVEKKYGIKLEPEVQLIGFNNARK